MFDNSKRNLIMRALILVFVGLVLLAPSIGHAQTSTKKSTSKTQLKPQTRAIKERVKVDPKTIEIDDGDSIVIAWPDGDKEIVRILGIDSPEVRHLEHNLPFDQAFGLEAKAFASGAFAAATEVELIRYGNLDPFGRTLGYLFINGKNYSLMIIKAHLAAESVSIYGDNGFPELAAEVVAAAKSAGPTRFEAPGLYRTRMRAVTEDMKKKGIYPAN
jgi:endonuclease YncB( thermonuclease family)